jgi:hypothetical protein
VPKKYQILSNGSYVFVFKYDKQSPELLHIYARHGTDPDVAIKTWFEGDRTVWNVEFNRYQTSSEFYTVHWFWLEGDKAVMIISCFPR